jgi:hypothetical protein
MERRVDMVWKGEERVGRRRNACLVLQSRATEVRDEDNVGNRDEPKFPLFSAPTNANHS